MRGKKPRSCKARGGGWAGRAEGVRSEHGDQCRSVVCLSSVEMGAAQIAGRWRTKAGCLGSNSHRGNSIDLSHALPLLKSHVNCPLPTDKDNNVASDLKPGSPSAVALCLLSPLPQGENSGLPRTSALVT